MVNQGDRTGPHCCKVYKEEISKYFHQREWLIFNQPPQSPVANVKDACLFLMWSKAVSSDQALSIGSNLLGGGQIYQKFQKVFWGNTFIPAISLAYSGHHQIYCVLLHYGGDNNYLSKRQGVSFGVRKKIFLHPNVMVWRWCQIQRLGVNLSKTR